MRLRDHCHPRVQMLLDLLASALMELQNSSPGWANGMTKRLLNYEPNDEPEDRLIRIIGIQIESRKKANLELYDEALRLLGQAVELRDVDDDSRYIDLASMVRIHLNKCDQIAAYQLMADSAVTAIRTESLPHWVAYDMLILAQFGDLHTPLKVPAYFAALEAYESCVLDDKNLDLANVWKKDPERALSLLIHHNPHSNSSFDPDSGPESCTTSDS